MRIKPILPAAFLFLATPVFAQDIASEIHNANAAWEQAFSRGDAAALAALYTENATALPPGAPAAHGRAAIQQLWQGAINSGLKDIHLVTDNVESYGAAAREIGHFSAQAPGQGGAMAPVAGKYVVIWKQEGPAWRLDTDIWNLNK